jgi:hypothetical protein
VALLALTCVSGCGDRTRSEAAFSVRDSAGIRIAESETPEWREGANWTVASGPGLDIGVADGDPALLFSRVAGVLELESGEIVVADGGSGEIRVFDESGRHKRTFGATGEGPGEFRQLLDLVGRSGDTLFLNDDNHEIEAFHLDGTHVGTTRFEASSYPVASVAARFSDGRLMRATSPQPLPAPPGLTQWLDSTTFLLYDESGRFSGEVARRPIIEFRVEPDGRPGTTYLGPIGSLTTTREKIYYSYPDGWNIEVRSPDGTLIELIRRSYTPVTVTAAHEAAAKSIYARQLASLEGPRLERILQSMRFAPVMTVHNRMLVDPTGALWVNESDADAILDQTASILGAGRWWSVFSPEGRWLGRVRMPDGLTVLSIGRDNVAGIRRDELDVEHVQLYELSRQEQDPR